TILFLQSYIMRICYTPAYNCPVCPCRMIFHREYLIAKADKTKRRQAICTAGHGTSAIKN
ncbi:MAG TPA: hypothetical protein VHA52_03175, partial [Candidatus Babeliaceae bacterium]|nr:hypothetical protein [Candidatus Babeliaceae bacterium]